MNIYGRLTHQQISTYIQINIHLRENKLSRKEKYKHRKIEETDVYLHIHFFNVFVVTWIFRFIRNVFHRLKEMKTLSSLNNTFHKSAVLLPLMVRKSTMHGTFLLINTFLKHSTTI